MKKAVCSLRVARRYFLRGYMVSFYDRYGNLIDGIQSLQIASKRHYRRVFENHLFYTPGIASCVVEFE